MARRLPVTLVGGFLGAGKTSLLHHLITEHRGGHLALIVEASGELVPDARALRGLLGAMRREQDMVVEIPPGDNDVQAEALLARLREFATAGRFERAIMEASGTTYAIHWARRLAEPDYASWAVVERIVCVVDLLEFDRALFSSSTVSPSLIDFQRTPPAQADTIVLNKCDLADDATRQRATRALRALNPRAAIVETAYGEVSSTAIFAPPVGSPRGRESIALRDESPDAALESVVYRAYRPFHPGRFWDWFGAEHAGLLRVKGIVWLATRNLLVGGISRTALQNSCGAAGIWWAALPREEWPESAEALAQMQAVWREPFGDRRQELLLIGRPVATATAARQLNVCFLTETEMARPVAEWALLPDPFPTWDLETDEP